MQPDNKAAYESLVTAITAFRAALTVAADSPIPVDLWNEYGRSMQLMERVRVGLKPKGL